MIRSSTIGTFNRKKEELHAQQSGPRAAGQRPMTAVFLQGYHTIWLVWTSSRWVEAAVYMWHARWAQAMAEPGGPRSRQMMMTRTSASLK
jgi:hypothetical protein